MKKQTYWIEVKPVVIPYKPCSKKGKKMEININAHVKIPRVPNFISLKNGEKVPISAIKEDYLQEIGKEWTANLITRAREMKDDKAN